MDIKYVLRVCSGATFQKMKDALEVAKQKSHGEFSTAFLFFDMVGSALRYGAGYNDYIIFEFWNVPKAQRKNYMTRIKNKRFVASQNDPAYSYIFDQKDQFYARFQKYLGRETLPVKGLTLEAFTRFAEKEDTVIAKPSVGEGGHGIEKLKKADFGSLEDMYRYVTDPVHDFGVVEQVIVQHPAVAAIYPHSVNCLRVVTLVTDGQVHFLYAMFKTGNNGAFVDNHCSGGYMCHFDLEKGEVTGPGHTIDLVLEDVHPYTGVPFKGFKIPLWEETKAMLSQAALEVPQFHYVGWDVAITEKGPVIIEGNDYPAYDLYQIPEKGRKQTGFLELLRRYIPDLK